MGQYHKIYNITKKEFLHPHAFDDGLKLMEFGDSAGGTLLALTILLAVSNGRGGGDAPDSGPKAKEYLGRWAGDKIAIVGDYAEANDLPWISKDEFDDLKYGADGWVDISQELKAAFPGCLRG